MKSNLLLTSLLIVPAMVGLAFAEIPIYCPKCKTLLYYYQKDKIIPNTQILAKDFKPASKDILQPQENTEMVCPLDSADLNGWEYWGKSQHFKSFTLVYKAISLLSKDKDDKWVWIPYDMPELNFNEGK